MKEVKRIKELITLLNNASNEYYNGKKTSMTDNEWDILFDELKGLESNTGIVYGNSPTQNAGYIVANNLPKIKHSTPLLSLDKTKSIDDLISWLGDREGILMHKMDGGTCCTNYNGELDYLATRGSSATNEGQDITHNSSSIIGIPKTIQNVDHIQVVGENYMLKSKLDEINSTLLEEDQYANARNLANATSSMLDSKVVAERDIRFMAFSTLECDIFNTKEEEHEFLQSKGFNVVPHVKVNKNNLRQEVERMTKQRKDLPYDIDGLVLAHNDIAYGKSLGKTSHHFKNAIAFKFEDEEVETTLRDIIVDVGKSGQISYVAEFNTVDLEGSQVSKASLSNYNLIDQLRLGLGDRIMVRKANAIIPQVVENVTKSGTFKKVEICPICGSKLIHKGVHQFCINYNCERQIVGRLVHWCSRDAMNIEGMSEETIKAIREIKNGSGVSMLNTVADIYSIPKNKDALIKLDRFGQRKVEKLCRAIEKSKTMPLSNVIYGLSIPQVGKKASKLLAVEFITIEAILKQDYNEFDIMDLIGDSVGNSFVENFLNNENITRTVELLCSCGLNMIQPQEIKLNILEGKNFVVTGSVNIYKNRKELQAKVESLGGKVSGSVSKNTNYLINNDVNSSSSKNKKAKNLGVPIITEEEFDNMIKR